MSFSATESSKEKPERSKTERLEARVSKEQKELFQRAADIQGRTLYGCLSQGVTPWLRHPYSPVKVQLFVRLHLSLDQMLHIKF